MFNAAINPTANYDHRGAAAMQARFQKVSDWAAKVDNSQDDKNASAGAVDVFSANGYDRTEASFGQNADGQQSFSYTRREGMGFLGYSQLTAEQTSEGTTRLVARDADSEDAGYGIIETMTIDNANGQIMDYQLID